MDETAVAEQIQRVTPGSHPQAGPPLRLPARLRLRVDRRRARHHQPPRRTPIHPALT